MAAFILLSILFVIINSYFFPPSKLYPWLLSLLSISSPPKPTLEKPKPEPTSTNTVDHLDLAFSTFDTDGDGFITVGELHQSLRRLGISATESDVRKMVERVDANGDGLIDVNEFRELYESFEKSGSAEEEDVSLREAFEVFDGNGDGVITVEELRLVLKSLGLRQGEADCRDMIRKVDLDGDGMVNFEEFKKMMKVKGGKFF